MASRRRALVIGLWLLGLYAAWILAWWAHQALASGPWPGLRDEPIDTLVWTGAKLAIWIAPVLLLVRRFERAPLATWLDIDRADGWRRAIVIAVCSIAAAGCVEAAFGGLPAPVHFSAGTLSACVVAPLFEELVFRGYLLRALTRSGLGFVAANAIAAVAFALLHAPGWAFMGQSAVQIASGLAHVAVLGFLFGLARIGGASLWPSIAVHAANNAWSSGALRGLWLALRASP